MPMEKKLAAAGLLLTIEISGFKWPGKEKLQGRRGIGGDGEETGGDGPAGRHRNWWVQAVRGGEASRGRACYSLACCPLGKIPWSKTPNDLFVAGLVSCAINSVAWTP